MTLLPSSTDGHFNWAQLLEAASRKPSSVSCEFIVGKRVLITGAGGSIGSALSACVAALAPESLLLLESSENALYTVDRELRRQGSTSHSCILGRADDEDCLLRLFETHLPEVVLHTAAFKHVPLMEVNPCAALANNAVGTWTLAKVAAAFHAAHFLLVSTDKAANPASVMGASKRIAELAALSIAGECPGMKTAVVRLGNVLGSHGSVLPLFQEQLAVGSPLTVTHAAATRYFMTMQQAVEAIFAALDLPHSPALLVPELGQQRSVLDLACHLKEERNRGGQGSDAAIQFTGLRPGDKLQELLLSENERWGETLGRAGGLRLVTGPRPPFPVVESVVSELNRAIAARDTPRLFDVVSALVPEYRPSSLIASSLRQGMPAALQDAEPQTLSPCLA